MNKCVTVAINCLSVMSHNVIITAALCKDFRVIEDALRKQARIP